MYFGLFDFNSNNNLSFHAICDDSIYFKPVFYIKAPIVILQNNTYRKWICVKYNIPLTKTTIISQIKRGKS